MEPHERLRAVREALDLTQTEFGKKLRMAVSSISSAETGLNKISPRLLYLLSILYRVNEKWILTGEGNMFLERPSVDGVPDDILDNPRATRDFIIRLQKEVAELREENERSRRIIDRLTQ